ncbi:MAG: sporulation membrane protein YtaF [Oscillospiraceae bacterium]|jgi:putative sporulation protein YtaF|nr:sporulation membrane protein YtaF [Oscillospiraceae bacterium]
MFFSLTQAFLLVFAVSADAFVSSFAYGVKKIKIPFSSVMVISVISSTILATSLFAGELIRPFLHENTANVLCFLILFTLGLIKLLDNAIKTLIKKHNRINRQLKFKLLNLNFILNVYANPEDADEDCSKVLSPAEAVPLAIALSLDGLAAGIGTALGGANKPLIIAFSLIISIIVITLGSMSGNKAASKSKVGFSWLGGAVLIILAIHKLI